MVGRLHHQDYHAVRAWQVHPGYRHSSSGIEGVDMSVFEIIVAIDLSIIAACMLLARVR